MSYRIKLKDWKNKKAKLREDHASRQLPENKAKRVHKITNLYNY